MAARFIFPQIRASRSTHVHSAAGVALFSHRLLGFRQGLTRQRTGEVGILQGRLGQ
jgi:hypothetical protein